MAKGFIHHALQHPPAGLEDIITWLYSKEDGPRLLQKVIDESKHKCAMEDNGETSASDREGGTRRCIQLSSGAVKMLRKQIAALETISLPT